MTRRAVPPASTSVAGHWWRLRDRRIRFKLAMILILPLVGIVALAGLIGANGARSAADANQARLLVALGGVGARLAGQLEAERATAALLFSPVGAVSTLDDYRRAASATDVVAAQFDATARGVAAPVGLSDLIGQITSEVGGLSALRQQVLASPDVTGSVTVFRYSAVVADLVSYRQALSQVSVDPGTANGLRAAAALSQAIEALGLEQVAVVPAIGTGQLTPAVQQQVVASDAGYTQAMTSFTALAPRWAQALNSRVDGDKVLTAERLESVAVHTAPGQPLRLQADAPTWVSTVSTQMVALHASEDGFDGDLLRGVTAQREAQQRSIVLLGSGVLGVLVVIVAVAWWVARSLARSLRRLRSGAEHVADVELPQIVAQIAAGSGDRDQVENLARRHAQTIRVNGRDEVGQVARAFNTAVGAAIRLAGFEAAARASVADIFLALSFRLQQRADRIIAALDDLESEEEDPDRLGRLFGLDHQATLLRRFISDLQVLAGTQPGRPTAQPVSLYDLLRAAVSQVDNYERVDFGRVDDDVAIAEANVPGVLLLLTEVLDNAVRFSPPDKRVQAEARRVGDRVHVQIGDEGPGLSDEVLRSIKDLQQDPNRVDQRVARQMGLPVVFRLAHQLGITVTYRSDGFRSGTGTRVDITLLGNVFVEARPRALDAVPASGYAGGAVQPVDRTVELPVVEGAPAAPPGPPSWPPSEPQYLPAVAARPVEAPPLAIFEAVRTARSVWFVEDGPEVDAVAVLPRSRQIPAAYREAGRASVTDGGLPQRRAGAQVFQPLATDGPSAPQQRDPAAVRRHMEAFQRGLNQAGRIATRLRAEEPTR